jgi:hypothetical protein
VEDQVDPLKDRLEHARNELNRKIRAGKPLDPEDLVDVRDDIVFVYLHLRNVTRSLEQSKVTRNPSFLRAWWILLATAMSGLSGWIVWLVTKGSGN